MQNIDKYQKLLNKYDRKNMKNEKWNSKIIVFFYDLVVAFTKLMLPHQYSSQIKHADGRKMLIMHFSFF
jgi:hypothetical protein